LQAFLDREFPVERKPAPQFFPDEAELLRLAENSVRYWIKDKLQSRPGYLQAVYVKDQAGLPEKLPKKLLGRDDLIAKLEKLFADSEKVLIFGMGGMGKTVLASTLAARHLEAKPGGVVMWHKMGSDEARFAFAAIAKP
jgi:transcriptional regulator of acetoin/glycerol metabolism